MIGQGGEKFAQNRTSKVLEMTSTEVMVLQVLMVQRVDGLSRC